ncbi:DcaP family trimeric outer membrane transporter [Coraliomargarita akajimensis]|uniref:DcaP family trimeric outer membrane transporter n=1 Tax=Coraliomargarita akajimensis TaxID=395922 RepID=UPI00059F4AD1|nr:DcaP family trimeric outer membrane transporter [Coraliomargarita akajimensis]
MTADTELEELKASMLEMQKSMQAMQAKIDQLESERATQEQEIADIRASAAAPSSALPQATQQPALGPEHKGYFQIPNSSVIMKLNFKPRVDATVDTKNTGVPERFIPAKFPLKGSPDYSEGAHSNLTANGSQIRADLRVLDDPGDFHIYYQSDFYGESNKNMRYRLQHFYAEYYNFKAGFTTSVWEVADAWPDTLDYEGPNAVLFARRPLIHYKWDLSEELNLNFGVEQGDFFVDGTGAPGGANERYARLPDFALNARWENGGTRLQASTIVRDIGYRDGAGAEYNDTGWGVNLGGVVQLTDVDALRFLGVYGVGVGGMGNDTSFLDSDAGFNADGSFEALPYYSLLLAYTRNWDASWRSTFTYGYADLDPASAQDGGFFSNTTYASGNLIYQIDPRWSAGVELLYGMLEAQDGRSSGDIFRFQFGMSYSIY